jgi:DNA primase
MARPLWSGNLQISLVSFGVGLVTATSPTGEISFHQIDRKTGQRVRPDQIVTKMTKSARSGKVYLDYLLNDRGSSAVAPYSPRVRAGVPDALAPSWSELDGPKKPSFAVAKFKQWRTRLANDPWKELTTLDQVLSLTRT